MAKNTKIKKRRKKSPVKSRKTAKKPAKARKKSRPILTTGLKFIGKITHYFPHAKAGVIKLEAPLCIGEKIYIKGHTTDFKEKVKSIEIDRAAVQSAKAPDEIGILVAKRVRAGDSVYKL